MDKIKSFDDQDWKNLVSEFKERVEKDKKLGIDSVFLPIPEICPNPKYLLLGMEPSTPEKDEKTRMNFFPIFLHYCAYKYLGEKGFNYYISDFAKGAMPPPDARRTENERYPEWLSLFEKEWKLLGEPEIIVMGKTMYDIIKIKFNGKFSGVNKIRGYLYHYDGRGPIYVRKDYDYIINKNPSELNSYNLKEAELREFAEKLKERLGPRCILSPAGYEDLIEHSLKRPTERGGIIFPVYSYAFERVSKGEKILHYNNR